MRPFYLTNQTKGTMTVEEIKAKHQPRQLENQVEFDAIMSDINQQQGELNRPLIDRKMEIVKQRELLNIQKQAINQQLSALSAEYQDIEAKAKAHEAVQKSLVLAAVVKACKH